MRWIIASALAFFASLLLPSAAYAWGQGGHYTVCQIGYLNLTPAAKAEVDRLVALDGRFASFTETCIFPDNPVARASEHYANYRRTDRRITGPTCPGGRPCVIEAIAHDLAILRSGTDASKATAILFIGHWFGDLHQPLHISFADDRGGNSIAESGPCTGSLHSVWDTCVIERKIFTGSASRLDRARAAAATLNAAVTRAQRRAWVRTQPWRWADESFQVTLQPKTGYCIRKPGACWYSASKQDFAAGDPQRTQTVDEAYLNWARPIVGERLKRGGIRLADALNRTFDPAYRP